MKSFVITAGVIALIALGCVVGLFVAAHSWEQGSSTIIEAMDRASSSAAPVQASDLAGLPPPVARYLRAVIPEGMPPIRMARIEWRGEFLLEPKQNGWRLFRAREVFTARPAAYLWDARIRSGPVTIFVRDGFADSVGFTRAALAGAVKVANTQGTREVATAELQRYLAETVWFPTALLPGQGVRWAAVDDTTARATLTQHSISASVEFHFGADGLIHSVFAPARYRQVGDHAVPTPWRGSFEAYENRDGLRIPRGGEVAWMLPEGPQPYWRGHIRSATYLNQASRSL